MIKARHTTAGRLFFDFYSKRGLKRTFRKVNFIGNFTDEGTPVVVIANHFSWWDGFIQLQLNKQYFERRFHVMMLEEQLRKFMILNTTGAFSVKQGSRSVIESLKYSAEIASDNKNMLLLFPQGKIESVYTSNFRFEKGLDYILKHGHEKIQLVFNINLIDFFSEKKPTLNVYFTKYEKSDRTIKAIEEAFNSFANKCKNLQTNPETTF